MTQLDLRRRIVRYLIEEDRPIRLDHLEKAIGIENYILRHLNAMIADGMIIHNMDGVAIRNLSDAEQWLIDTMPRTPAEE